MNIMTVATMLFPWKVFLLCIWYFFAVIQCLRKFFCYVHDDFMNMNFDANCFISFRVENSKENKDMLKKNWQKMLDFLHEINSQLISQFALNYLKKFFVFAVQYFYCSSMYKVELPMYRSWSKLKNHPCCAESWQNEGWANIS